MKTRIVRTNQMMKNGTLPLRHEDTKLYQDWLTTFLHLLCSFLSSSLRSIKAVAWAFAHSFSHIRFSSFTSWLLTLALLLQIVAPSILALNEKPDPAKSTASSKYTRLGSPLRPNAQDFTPQEMAVEAAIVRHLGSLNGRIEGTVRHLVAENVTLNGGAAITSALLIPGTPTVQQNGNPTFGGTVQGTGSA